MERRQDNTRLYRNRTQIYILRCSLHCNCNQQSSFLFTLLPFSSFFLLIYFSVYFKTSILLYPFSIICTSNWVLSLQKLCASLIILTDQINQNISNTHKKLFIQYYKRKNQQQNQQTKNPWTPFENKIRWNLFAKKNNEIK